MFYYSLIIPFLHHVEEEQTLIQEPNLKVHKKFEHIEIAKCVKTLESYRESMQNESTL